MKHRWEDLWHRVGAHGSADAVFTDVLLPRYIEPHRHYHTLQHVRECLDELDLVLPRPGNTPALELAIWFHDVVYDVKEDQNEEKSADLAQQVLGDAAVPSNLITLVRDHIIATKHVDSPASIDTQILVDVDLAILGKPAKRFWEYEQQIRQEYSWVADPVFAAGRTKVLTQLLRSRALIYHTPAFQDRYELLARRNLVNAIWELNRGAR